MQGSRKPKVHLTDDHRAKVLAAVAKGGNRAEIAERYGVSPSTVYSIVRSARGSRPSSGRPRGGGRGHLTPERLRALNADIMAGKPESEIRQAHGISTATIYRRRDQLAHQAEGVEADAYGRPPEPEVVMTPEQIARIMGVLSRVAEKRPDVFAKLGIVQKLAQFPLVLMEVM